MVPDRLHDNGTGTFLDGWKRTVIVQSTMNRPCIMHGLFVDDMVHTSTSEKMMVKFFKLYSKTLK